MGKGRNGFKLKERRLRLNLWKKLSSGGREALDQVGRDPVAVCSLECSRPGWAGLWAATSPSPTGWLELDEP